MLHKMQWRYATKKFDSTKKVDEEIITELLKNMNLTASAYGLQPYRFIVVHNAELQKELQAVSYGQEQVVDASHLIVIAARTELGDEDIDSYISNIAQTRNQNIEELQGYSDMMKKDLLSREKNEQFTWSQRQSYIPLGTLLVAAADKKVDACPMEGFIPEKLNEILNLTEKGLHATAMVALGYRAQEDHYQHEKKVRRELADMVSLRYDT